MSSRHQRLEIKSRTVGWDETPGADTHRHRKPHVARIERERNPGCFCRLRFTSTRLLAGNLSVLSKTSCSSKIHVMQNAKASQPIRQRVKVQRGRRAEITSLSFPAGSEIDVIVTAAQARTSKKSSESICDRTAAVVRRKRIRHYSLKQIEDIIHQSRVSRGTFSTD